MYFSTVTETISTLSVTAVSAYAGYKGGATERWGAVLTFANWMITPLVQNTMSFSSDHFALFLVDLVYLVGLLMLALRGAKYWPLWAAGFYLLEVLMHVDMMIDHKVRARAFFIGMEIFSYLSLFALAVGVWRETTQHSTSKSIEP